MSSCTAASSRDILSGTLPAHRQKLPSKRALAQHLEVSVITVQNAYEQLAAEGYIYWHGEAGLLRQPRGAPLAGGGPAACPAAAGAGAEDLFSGPCDQFHRPGVLSLYRLGPPHAGDACWSEDTALLQAAPYNGAAELRRAISRLSAPVPRHERGQRCRSSSAPVRSCCIRC